jgi:hypothetical protein
VKSGAERQGQMLPGIARGGSLSLRTPISPVVVWHPVGAWLRASVARHFSAVGDAISAY